MMPPYQDNMGVPQMGSQPNFSVNPQPMQQPIQTDYNAAFGQQPMGGFGPQQPQMGGMQPGAGFNPMGPVYPQTYPAMGGLQQASGSFPLAPTAGTQPMVTAPPAYDMVQMNAHPQMDALNTLLEQLGLKRQIAGTNPVSPSPTPSSNPFRPIMNPQLLTQMNNLRASIASMNPKLRDDMERSRQNYPQWLINRTK